MRWLPSSQSTRPLLGLAIVLLVIGVLIAAELAADTDVESEAGILIAIVLVSVIGGFLVARRPNHPVSWLMALGAIIGAISGLSAEVLPPGMTEISGWRVVVATVSGPTWYGLLVTILVLIPLLFPSGSPPTPRWRWVARSALSGWGVMSLAWAFQERYCTDFGDEGCRASVRNPIGIEGLTNPEQSAVGAVFFGLLLICSLAALASLIVRYRRSVGVERQQIKWVLLSVAVFVGFILIVDVFWIETLGGVQPPGYKVAQAVIWVMIPASVAVAILRYRLYDIDRIISRTVSYALVIGVLGLIALALVSLFALFLPSDDPLVVAIATLAAAALFNPLRVRIQALVDRRFNRTRYNVERVIDHFTGSLQERVDADRVVEDWVGVVSETMQPSTLGVWVRP